MMGEGGKLKKGGRERSSPSPNHDQPINNRTQKQKDGLARDEGQRPATKNRMPLGSHRKAKERLKIGKG